MTQLNENVTINLVELNNWKYDEDDFMLPVSYDVNMTFFGHEYQLYFTTGDLQRAEKWWLENSGCEGYSPLFDSAESYFENNEKEADALIKLMEEEWEDNWRGDSPYNYMGLNESKEGEQ